jgi:hypothetical protein
MRNKLFWFADSQFDSEFERLESIRFVSFRSVFLRSSVLSSACGHRTVSCVSIDGRGLMLG